MFRKVIIIAFAAAVSACATPPANYSFDNSRSYSKPYDKVWENLVEFLAQRNIQIKNIAKDSGVIYAEAVKFDDSVADCGMPGIMQITGRRANFNIFVKRSSNDPVVSVNAEFNEIRRFESNIETVTCNSKGFLENLILSAAAQ